MATVGFIASQKFPSPGEILDHLTRCHDAGNKIVILSSDRQLKKMLEGLSIPFKSYKYKVTSIKHDGTRGVIVPAHRQYASLLEKFRLVEECDHVVVFHEVNSPTTEWWATREGKKFHVVAKGKKRKPAQRKGRPRSE